MILSIIQDQLNVVFTLLIAMSQLKIFILTCMLFVKVLCSHNLENIFMDTDFFFDELLKKYESKELNNETKLLIDEEIEQYTKTVIKQMQSEQSNQVYESFVLHADVFIFDGLEGILKFDGADVNDMHVFKKYSGHENWFGTTLTESYATIYKIMDKSFIPIIVYPILNASKVHVIKYQESVLIFIQSWQSIKILHFFPQDGKFSIQEIPSIDNLFGVKDFSVWREDAALFMAITTSSQIYLYTCWEARFDLLQILPFGSAYSRPFRAGAATYLVVSSERSTAILARHPRTRQFSPAQMTRRSSGDAAVVRVLEERGEEHLLVLAAADRTIVLKRAGTGAFAPFQELAPAERVLSISRKHRASLLLLLNGGVVDVYQYDGWRFVRLQFRLVGVRSMKKVDIGSEKHLLIGDASGRWKLYRILWTKMKEPINRRAEIIQWCLETIEKIEQDLNNIPVLDKTIRIPNAQVEKLNVRNINGISIETIADLTNRCNNLLPRLAVINATFSQALPLKDMHFKSLRVQKVRVNCPGHCRVDKLIMENECDVSNLRSIDDKNLDLTFDHVKVDRLDGFPCPKAGVKLDEVRVTGLINGISLEDLEENVLKTSGDQVITGHLIFEELKVDSLVSPSVNVATSHTSQPIRMVSVRAHQLNLMNGGGLLPRNGEPVTMTGTLTASRVRLDGPVYLRGSLRGRGVRPFAPMVSFPGKHRLHGNYTLGNVVVTDRMVAGNLLRPRGRSLREIVKKAVPLDGDVPVRMIFSKERTVWTNVTVPSLPKWLIKNNAEMVEVTGKKTFLNNVTLSENIYAQLPIPKFRAHLCGVQLGASNIKTSSVNVGRMTAEVVVAKQVLGAKELEYAMEDSVTCLGEIDLSRRNFTGFVFIENANITNLENSPFYSFKNAKFDWYRPDYIEQPVKVKNLKVNSIIVREGIKIPFPRKIKNLKVEGNLNVKTINHINLREFMDNVVKIDDVISLKNVTFVGTVEADEVEALTTNVDLRSAEDNAFLGEKIISGDLEVEGDLNIPNLLSFPPTGEVETYVIEGTIRFKKPPIIEILNGKNVTNLISEIWMCNRPEILRGKISWKNVTLPESFDTYENYKLLHTPTFGSWESLENRIFSKTKSQEINVPINFESMEVPNIVVSDNATLRCFDKNLNDLMYKTLKKDEDQIIINKWYIKELSVEDSCVLEGKVNNLNLSTDVARYDVDVHYVTGTKTVDALSIKQLRGLKFDEWAKDALLKTNTQDPLRITGKKIFNTLSAQTIEVTGKVMDKNISDCLLKSGDQIMKAPLTVEGSVHAPSITINGMLNDINITDFTHSSLKKHRSVQMIKSKMMFKENLKIMGDLDIKGKIQGVNLKPNWVNETFAPVMSAIEYLEPFALAINAALKRQAKFWDEFEYVKENITLPTNHSTLVSNSLSFPRLGNCVLTGFSVVCSEGTIIIVKGGNSSNLLINKLLSMEGAPLVVQVNSGPRSRIAIYKYVYSMHSFIIAANLRVPGITDAQLISVDEVVWIVTRLPSMMLVVRYHACGDVQKYHLPDSRLFALDVVPATNEPILVRDDGMWRLEGLAGPRRTFEVGLTADSVETIAVNGQFYVKLICRGKGFRLLKARYVGV